MTAVAPTLTRVLARLSVADLPLLTEPRCSAWLPQTRPDKSCPRPAQVGNRNFLKPLMGRRVKSVAVVTSIWHVQNSMETGHDMRFVDNEDHRQDRVIRAGKGPVYVANTWIPWAFEAASWPLHRITLVDDVTKTILWSIWQQDNPDCINYGKDGYFHNSVNSGVDTGLQYDIEVTSISILWVVRPPHINSA